MCVCWKGGELVAMLVTLGEGHAATKVVNILPCPEWIRTTHPIIDMEWKGCGLIGCWTHNVTLNFDLTHDLDQKVKFSNSPDSGMGGLINMEWKECESIAC